jgi:predicted 3-demethylubiquinone-9 3-methyltransferase (glyoxalase superfamily)
VRCAAERVVGGHSFMGCNGGPDFSVSEGISLYADCADQQDADDYWDKLVIAGARRTACGWIKNLLGHSRQLVLRRFIGLTGERDSRRMKAVMDAMTTTVKPDVAELKRACDEA